MKFKHGDKVTVRRCKDAYVYTIIDFSGPEKQTAHLEYKRGNGTCVTTAHTSMLYPTNGSRR